MLHLRDRYNRKKNHEKSRRALCRGVIAIFPRRAQSARYCPYRQLFTPDLYLNDWNKRLASILFLFSDEHGNIN